MTVTTDEFLALNRHLDKRDFDLLCDRLKALDAHDGPRVGDFVDFACGTSRRVSYLWDFTDEGKGLLAQTSDGGSYYLGNGYVSMSGGLHPAIPTDTFRLTGESRMGRCWFFHHDLRRAHNGVDVVLPFRVYATTQEANR